MRIIVTGGLGFVGSNIIKFFNKKGIFDILVVDKFDIRDKCFKHIRL